LTAADRLLVQARDLCQEVDAPVAAAVGFEGDVPATLLFIKAREEQVDLSVSLLVGMRLAFATVITPALMNFRHRHRRLSQRGREGPDRSGRSQPLGILPGERSPLPARVTPEVALRTQNREVVSCRVLNGEGLV